MLESYKIYKQRSEDENGILIDDNFPISEAARKNNYVFASAKNSRPRIDKDVHSEAAGMPLVPHSSYVFAKQKIRHLRIDMKVNFRTPMDGRGSMQKRRFGFAKTRRPRIDTDVSFSTVMDDGGSMQ